MTWRATGETLLAPVLTAGLLLATAQHAPTEIRLPLAVLVFFLAPGVASLGVPRRDLALRWAAVIGLSLGVTLALAEVLVVTKHLFVLPYLWYLLGTVCVSSLVTALLRQRSAVTVQPVSA